MSFIMEMIKRGTLVRGNITIVFIIIIIIIKMMMIIIDIKVTMKIIVIIINTIIIISIPKKWHKIGVSQSAIGISHLMTRAK